MCRTSIFGTSKDSNGNVKFGTFWQVDAQNQANQVSDYRAQLVKYGNALKVGQETEAAGLLQAFTQSGATADAEAIRAAVEATGDYSEALEKVIKDKQNALKATSNFSAGLKGLGNIAKTVGASLLNGLIAVWKIDTDHLHCKNRIVLIVHIANHKKHDCTQLFLNCVRDLRYSRNRGILRMVKYRLCLRKEAKA